MQTYVVAGDLGTTAGVQAVIDSARQAPGPVDILYNNAAIQNPFKPIWDITPRSGTQPSR